MWKSHDFSITQILREIKFWQIQTVQKCHFGNFRDSELWIWENLGFESCSNVLKIKIHTSKMAKNDIFGPFEFAEIWFHVKSDGGKVIKLHQSQALTSHFQSVWSIVFCFFEGKEEKNIAKGPKENDTDPCKFLDMISRNFLAFFLNFQIFSIFR